MSKPLPWTKAELLERRERDQQHRELIRRIVREILADPAFLWAIKNRIPEAQFRDIGEAVYAAAYEMETLLFWLATDEAEANRFPWPSYQHDGQTYTSSLRWSLDPAGTVLFEQFIMDMWRMRGRDALALEIARTAKYAKRSRKKAA